MLLKRKELSRTDRQQLSETGGALLDRFRKVLIPRMLAEAPATLFGSPSREELERDWEEMEELKTASERFAEDFSVALLKTALRQLVLEVEHGEMIIPFNEITLSAVDFQRVCMVRSMTLPRMYSMSWEDCEAVSAMANQVLIEKGIFLEIPLVLLVAMPGEDSIGCEFFREERDDGVFFTVRWCFSCVTSPPENFDLPAGGSSRRHRQRKA